MATAYLPYNGPGYADYSGLNASIQTGLAGLVQAQQNSHVQQMKSYETAAVIAREDRAAEMQWQNSMLELARQKTKDNAEAAANLIRLQTLRQQQQEFDLKAKETMRQLAEGEMQRNYLSEVAPVYQRILSTANPVNRQVMRQDLTELHPGFDRFATGEMKELLAGHLEQDSKVYATVNGVQVSAVDLAARIRAGSKDGSTLEQKLAAADAIAAAEAMGGSRTEFKYFPEQEARIDFAKNNLVQFSTPERAQAEEDVLQAWSDRRLKEKALESLLGNRDAGSRETWSEEYKAAVVAAETHLEAASLTYGRATKNARAYNIDPDRLINEISGLGAPAAPAGPSPETVAAGAQKAILARLAQLPPDAAADEGLQNLAAAVGEGTAELIVAARNVDGASPYSQEGRAAIYELSKLSLGLASPLAALGISSRPLDPAMFLKDGERAVLAAKSAGEAARFNAKLSDLAALRETNPRMKDEIPPIPATAFQFPGLDDKPLTYDQAAKAATEYLRNPPEKGTLERQHAEALLNQLAGSADVVATPAGLSVVPASKAPPAATPGQPDGLLRLGAVFNEANRRTSRGRMFNRGWISPKRDRFKLSARESTELRIKEVANGDYDQIAAGFRSVMSGGDGAGELLRYLDAASPALERALRFENKLLSDAFSPVGGPRRESGDSVYRVDPRTYTPDGDAWGEYKAPGVLAGAADVAWSLNSAFTEADRFKAGAQPSVDAVAKKLKDAAGSYAATVEYAQSIGLPSEEAERAASARGAFGARLPASATLLLDNLLDEESMLSLKLGTESRETAILMLRSLLGVGLTLGKSPEDAQAAYLANHRLLFGDAPPARTPAAAASAGGSARLAAVDKPGPGANPPARASAADAKPVAAAPGDFADIGQALTRRSR